MVQVNVALNSASFSTLILIFYFPVHKYYYTFYSPKHYPHSSEYEFLETFVGNMPSNISLVLGCQ